jgi:hypothetical protein
VAVTELGDDTAIVVMDATGTGFDAAVGDLEHLAQLIADHPTRPYHPTR